MLDSLRKYVIEPDADTLLALERIDLNQKGFLVVVRNGTFLGTLTDGDIRRAFIHGKTLDVPISDIYTRGSIVLSYNEGFPKAMDLLANRKIGFLPVVDNDGSLVNILTKRQLQVALLHNLQVGLDYDFESLDESALDHEITRKPWGFYKTTVLSDIYQTKVLGLAPCSSLSLQQHRFREEYWLVVFGNGEAQVGDSMIPLTGGSFVFVPKGCKHRLRNTESDATLVVVEMQLGGNFDENDIERLEDEYGRA